MCEKGSVPLARSKKEVLGRFFFDCFSFGFMSHVLTVKFIFRPFSIIDGNLRWNLYFIIGRTLIILFSGLGGKVL